MTDTKKTAKKAAGRDTTSSAWTAEEKSAMKERAKEMKAEERRGTARADGERDLLVGGMAGWLYYGPLGTGTVPISGVADDIAGMWTYGTAGLAGLGDIDADGFDDFAMSDSSADTDALGGGKTYLFFGGAR